MRRGGTRQRHADRHLGRYALLDFISSSGLLRPTLSPALAAGAKAWLSPPLPSWEAYLEAGGLEPDPLELYQWDLQGVLHLKGVLSERSVARALASIEANRRGETGEGRGDVISWANGFGAPFREMMAHPAVLARLAWMQGPGSCNNSRSLFCYERGDGGQGIHGDVTGTGPGSQCKILILSRFACCPSR